MTARNCHFKWIAFCVVSHGTNQHQARFPVVNLGAEHLRRTPPSRLMPGLGIKSQPAEVSAVGYVGGCHHDSRPAGGPQSDSECRFFAVIRDTSCLNSYFLRAGRKTIVPSVARSSVSRSPSARRASLAIVKGIRTARLFPHLEIWVPFGICIYLDYTSFRRGSRVGAQPFWGNRSLTVAAR